MAQAKGNLEKIAKAYGTNSQEYKKAERALNSYGAEGVKNGVSIFATASDGRAHTLVAGVTQQTTKDNPTGQNIRVNFDPKLFGEGPLDGTVIHEGSHVADGSDWVKSGFKGSANPTEYRTEFDAYTVAGIYAQAAAPNGSAFTRLSGFKERGKNPYLPEKVTLWDSGWKAADIATLRSQNINKLLAAPERAGGYNVTPSKPGTGWVRGSRF